MERVDLNSPVYHNKSHTLIYVSLMRHVVWRKCSITDEPYIFSLLVKMKVQWNIKFINTSMSSTTNRVDKSKHKNFLESPLVLNICLLNCYKKDTMTSATCIDLNFLFHWLQILVFTFQMGLKWHQLLALEVQDSGKKNLVFFWFEMEYGWR